MENTTTPINSKKKKKSRTVPFVVGFMLGLLFMGSGLYLARNKFIPKPIVQTKTVDKVVTKIVIKEVKVPTETIVQKHRIWKATLYDDKGNVVQSWLVKKCKFIVIGANLTDVDGNEFRVDGDIKIEPVK